MSLKETLYTKLKAGLNPTYLEVIDESSLHANHFKEAIESHFKIIIVSEAFKGLSALKKHRLVYDLLKEEVPHIHALTLNLKTP